MTGSEYALDAAPARRERGCPVCRRARRTSVLGEKDGFPWRVCSDCKIRFAAKMPSDAELAELYGCYYRGGSRMDVPQFVSGRLSRIVRSFGSHRRGGKLLDVGFGAGTLLQAAAAEGWECWGTEISVEAARAGREQGWHVVEGDLCTLGLPDGLFDVVCMVELLEHVEDPVAYLTEAGRLLRQGGLLFATTPNGTGINGRWLGTQWSVFGAPEHLQLFSRRSIRKAVADAGLDLRSLRVEGFNPNEFWNVGIRHRTPRRSRVEAAYALNAVMESGSSLRLVKRAVNLALTLTGLGDRFKVRAHRPAAV